MFPVELATRSPLLSGGREGGDTSFLLEFTPEARRADFLFVADSPKTASKLGNKAAVFTTLSVSKMPSRDRKFTLTSRIHPPKSVTRCRCIWPANSMERVAPTFKAAERCGVCDPRRCVLDSYYTKLVRWVSEGRLLRDSNRGVLLVDNARAGVGDTITSVQS